MERIKQALERAREERQQHGEATGEPGLRPAGTPSPVADVRYTHTRNIEPSVEFLREQRVISAFGPGPYTESYKILRTQVLQRLRDGGWNTLAVTSAADDEGKTLTAINLAISLAQEVNHTVLLVDADLRHPRVHRYFGLEDCRGLSDYLTDDAPLNELLVHPKGSQRFVFLPGGRPLAHSAEMLNSPRMTRLVEELKKRYASRIVIFDLPPLLSAADALAFSPYVEAALLVIGEGQGKAEEVRRATELLQKTQLIGTVLTKAHGVMPNEDKGMIMSALDNRFVRGLLLGVQKLTQRLRLRHSDESRNPVD
jgi:capsular exopolysaccharide synthesis family protein